MKFIAGACAPGAEQTCQWMSQGIQRHEQNTQYSMLALAVAMLLTAVFLIIFLFIKSKRR